MFLIVNKKLYSLSQRYKIDSKSQLRPAEYCYHFNKNKKATSDPKAPRPSRLDATHIRKYFDYQL